LRSFATTPKDDSVEKPKTDGALEAKKEDTLEKKEKYEYFPGATAKINEPTFVKRMQKLEEQNKHYYGIRNPWKGAMLPFLLCSAALFLYYLWQTIPYRVVFKSSTTSTLTSYVSPGTPRCPSTLTRSIITMPSS
jgi:hypothetical protein